MTFYRWQHHSYGTEHNARCGYCNIVISQWKQPWGTEGVPKSNRAAIEKHLATHER